MAISLLFLLMVIAGCGGVQTLEPGASSSGSVPATQEQIVNIVWQWSDVTENEPAGQSVIADPENYTLTLLPDGTANVKADCNRISWPYTMEGNKLTFNAIFATTLAACPPGSLDQQFLDLLGRTESAELENDRLILNLAGEAGFMGFNHGGPPEAESAATEEPTVAASVGDEGIVGITWRWLEFKDTAGNKDTTVPNPEDYTLLLQPDGTASIKADCNNLMWTYTLAGSSLTFNTLGPTTLALCPPESLDQQFLGLLADVATWVSGEEGKLVLNLKADAGNMIFGTAGNGESCVTGTITTAEPQDLQENAIIQVQIQDVSEADAPAKVIGEQILEAAGAQFPILYKVCYDPADIDERFSYSIGVRITDPDGTLLFISDTNTSVITQGHPITDVEIGVVPVGG